MIVLDLVRDLLKFNLTDEVFINLIEGKPALSVNEEPIIVGLSCDCEDCEKIRTHIPDFSIPAPPLTHGDHVQSGVRDVLNCEYCVA